MDYLLHSLVICPTRLRAGGDETTPPFTCVPPAEVCLLNVKFYRENVDFVTVCAIETGVEIE